MALTPQAFWSGRRVLITGHTGFIGSWLALALARLGASVAGLSLPLSGEPGHYSLARVGEGLLHHEGDLRDPAVARQAVAAVRPQIVFHLAAQALVRTAFADPLATFATNVMGTANLLDAVRAAPEVEAVVVYTTDKVYANREWPWPYREIDALGGHEPYAASKAAAEHVVEAYRHAYLAARVPIAVLRAGNVIGGGDWAADRLVPDAMRAFSRGESLHIRHPSAVRPWQHVLEPVGLTVLLGQLLVREPALAAQAWNVGPDPSDIRPVSWIADRLVSLWPGAKPWTTGTDDSPYEAHRLTLDSAKAQAELGWQPRWALDRALEESVRWYHGIHGGEDPGALSRGQVESYFANDHHG